MSKGIQDTFILDDDEEETCPLCVEEFDLTDKGFKPCPCGYQICQFCYNNVKNNMNGLCPACRRPYNDKDIQYKVITPEETAAHKARQAQRQKKDQQARQKEKARAEADSLSRKHLAGLRVVQKNLVYVTGLSPHIQEDELLQTLRGTQYFGQYGKIIKIVVSKARDKHESVGVYVTYERKQDAESCINAVNGSQNGERTLRAQFGTTKYCSAYLRGDTCMNRNCMFLHEPGEAGESYSRADLSALNAGSTQDGERMPPPQSQQPVSAAQPMFRQLSDQPQSPASADRPALPSTASWASKPPTQLSRAESRATSGTISSPAPERAVPVQSQEQPQAEQAAPAPETSPEPPLASPEPSAPQPVRITKPRTINPFLDLVKGFDADNLRMDFSTANISPSDLEIITNYPALFEIDGAVKRLRRRQREEERTRLEQEHALSQLPAPQEDDDNPEMSGSMQLGGEPEERPGARGNTQSSAQEGQLDQRFQFGGGVSSPAGITERGLTPQQHQQLLLQTMKSPNPQSNYLNSFNQQSAFQAPSGAPGHQRNTSRFSFANDSSASTAVKPVANQKLMSQQSSMMPPSGGNHFGNQHQAQSGQFFTSNVQGPPPGLKTSGTPPVSGGMTFGQGHGFTTGGIPYTNNAATGGRNEELMQNLLRGRNSSVAGSDAAKQDDPELPQPNQEAQGSRRGSISSSFPQLQESRRSTPTVPPGFEGESLSRRATPSIPPGFSKPPTALPDLEGGASRPSSRASLRRAVSGAIVPALPLTPGKNGSRAASRAASPVKQEAEEEKVEETPTKKPKAVVPKSLEEKAPAKEKGAKAGKGKEKAKEDVKPVAASVKAEPKAEADIESKEAAAKETAAQVKEALVKPPSKPEPKKADKGKTPSLATDETKGKVADPEAAAKSQEQKPAAETKAEPSTPGKADSKRKHPGKLDITAAVEKQNASTAAAAAASTATPVDNSTPGKQQQKPVSQTQTPSAVQTPLSPSVSVSSPAVKAAPRTLRVVQTPKAETPPAAQTAAPPLPTPAAVAGASKLPSRKPSVASMNLPGTPSSEQVSISDNISLTSTSQSRANSPPPPVSSRVGSAPVRNKTKNQQRKDRQERAKQLEEEKARLQEAADPTPEEPAQEAIVARKKKEKKAKEPKPAKPRAATLKSETPTANTTPTASRPTSPGPKERDAATPKVESKPATPSRVPSMPLQSPHNELSPPPTPTITPAQMISDLRAAAPEFQKALDTLFRTSSAASLKPNQPITQKDLAQNPAMWKPDFNIKLTRDEVEALLSGKVPCIQYGGEEGRIWDRGIVSPSGAHLRALSQELEQRFLHLEGVLRDLPEELKFHPTKPQNETRFPFFDLEALKREFDNELRGQGRGVSVMEAMVQDGAAMKKGAFLVDEASRYINEFVMPPATPPPNVATAAAAAGGVQMEAEVPVPVSLEVAERQLQDARRVAEEKEVAMKRVQRRNRKAAGLG